MSSSTDNMSMTAMTPWLHFGNTDYLLFKSWRPSSNGAIAGACIGLFLFCVLERCLAAYRRTQELRWMAKAIVVSNNVPRSSSPDKEDTDALPGYRAVPPRQRRAPPFTPSQDIPRGAIQAIQSTFSYTLMLAVMTFNGAYVISIILGLGVGEVLVGRIGRKRDV